MKKYHIMKGFTVMLEVPYYEAEGWRSFSSRFEEFIYLQRTKYVDCNGQHQIIPNEQEIKSIFFPVKR